jgi:hypothetical protein
VRDASRVSKRACTRKNCRRCAVVTPARAASTTIRGPSTRATEERASCAPCAVMKRTITGVGPEGTGTAGGQDGRAITEDISAGGMRVETILPLAAGDRVRITVETPRGVRKALPDTMVCHARVVRVEQVTRGHRLLSSAGLEFVFHNEDERDRWVQLTFDLQRGVVP